jgi:hypothetical protein
LVSIDATLSFVIVLVLFFIDSNDISWKKLVIDIFMNQGNQ